MLIDIGIIKFQDNTLESVSIDDRLVWFSINNNQATYWIHCNNVAYQTTMDCYNQVYAQVKAINAGNSGFVITKE